jgi:hypothetical protein
MSFGMLKPDTLHGQRLLAQPPGVNIMLIMYNRFHNYVADVHAVKNQRERSVHFATNQDK